MLRKRVLSGGDEVQDKVFIGTTKPGFLLVLLLAVSGLLFSKPWEHGKQSFIRSVLGSGPGSV